MIEVSDTRIMIVPDFGRSAEEEGMVALKNAIEATGCYTVKIVDLPAIVRAEQVYEKLKDAEVIELSARKLEQLASCDELVWDGTDTIEQRKSRVIRLVCSEGKLHRLPGQEAHPEYGNDACPEDKDEVSDFDETSDSENIDETTEFDIIDDIFRRDFPDYDDIYSCGAPDMVVVFGKSAMLAGGLGQKDVLFINPEYDTDWPWKKQYYADSKLSGQYHSDKYEYESGFMETVLWVGTEHTRPWRYSRRYGLITCSDFPGEFGDRYSRMTEVNRALDGDTAGIAEFICKFADGKLTFPLEAVYEAIKHLPGRDISNLNIICDFSEPVKLYDITVLGLRFGVPMANGQSCYKLKVAERNYTLPLESVKTRYELNALRDAIIDAGERLNESAPAQKRILIVPDYFTPYNVPNVRELYGRLRDLGHYVAVYVHGSSLEKSRAGIERRCKVKPFDLIVTLDSGFLVAGRVANCPRVMVNPDREAWKRMKERLGEDKRRTEFRGSGNSGPFFQFFLDQEEVAMARQMAERSYFKRFNTVICIRGLSLDTDKDMNLLVRQINNASSG